MQQERSYDYAKPGQPGKEDPDLITQLEAAAFRSLVDHLQKRSNEVSNLDLMTTAGFCRNCLAKVRTNKNNSVGCEELWWFNRSRRNRLCVESSNNGSRLTQMWPLSYVSHLSGWFWGRGGCLENSRSDIAAAAT
jgi:hypothetical protein